MVQTNSKKNPGEPWDDNLPKNKEYIQKFYQKSEQEIQQQTNENVLSNQFKDSGDETMNNVTKIVKVKKNPDGDITDVMLDNGNTLSINQAVMMAKDGLIEGVNVGRSKSGTEYLRGVPNGIESDNLDNLPTF